MEGGIFFFFQYTFFKAGSAALPQIPLGLTIPGLNPGQLKRLMW